MKNNLFISEIIYKISAIIDFSVEVGLILLACMVLIKGRNKLKGIINLFLFLLIFAFILKCLNPLFFLVLKNAEDD